MEKDLDPEVIKSTQIALGKYVKRPPLSEKLLKKPPFRFLHDVITTVLKTTGFFDKLFEEDELISDNVKDRDSKISFLTKVIFVINSTTGKSLSVKPSKIVAGQEPEKTNELLQCLAQVLDDKLSSDKAVKLYKDSLKSSQTTETKTKETTKTIKKGNDTKKLTSKSNEKLTIQKNDVSKSTTKQDKEKVGEVKSKRKENGSTKSEVQAHKTQSKTVAKKNAKEQKEDTSKSRTKNITPNVIEKEIVANATEVAASTLSNIHSQESDIFPEKEDQIDDKNNIELEDDQGKLNTSYTINDNELNTSVSSNELLEASQNKKPENNPLDSYNIIEITPHPNNINDDNQINIDLDNVPPKSLELEVNVSNNLKTPAVINKETDTKIIDTDKMDSLNSIKIPMNGGKDTKIPRPPSVRPSSVRPLSSRPGAPRMREKVDNVMKDTDNLLMGKVNIIVENTQHEEEEDTSLVIVDQAEAIVSSQNQQELQLSSSEHGHLVQRILETQKELSQNSGKTEIEWQFGAQRAREAMNQDIEQLRFNIQALSRVANPLGKLLDHVQEDVEVMRQELQQWSNIYEDVNKEMLKEKTLNEDSLMPFHTKLKQLKGDIEEKHEKINDLKILIHKNASRIEKLLASGNVQ